MISERADNLLGGLADDKEPEDFDPAQLAMGIRVEMEHTNDKAVAMEIAMDHLTEIPDYYTRLETMEDEANMKNETLVLTIGQLKALIKEAIEFGVADENSDMMGFLTKEMPEAQVDDLVRRLGLTRISHSGFEEDEDETFWLSAEDFDKVDDELKKHRGSGHSDEDAWEDYKSDLRWRARQKIWDKEDAALDAAQNQNYAKSEEALTRLLDQAVTSGREYSADNPDAYNNIDARDLVSSMKYDKDFETVMKYGNFDSEEYLIGTLADAAAGGLER